jgi:protein-L-isoaspartate(D-aspartate) O-methyltransferase
MRNNSELAQNLIKKGMLKSKKIINAFYDIDRGDFVISDEKENAYTDYPLPIHCGQTILQPSAMAFILELLDIQYGENILDVGSGSGWSTTLLAYLAGRTGQVKGVEVIPELVELGQKNLARYHFAHASIQEAKKDVYGLPKYAPYDKIMVSAAGSEIPADLVKQLKIGGAMIIPVDKAVFYFKKISKQDADIQKYQGFSFVPLISPQEQKNNFDLNSLPF